MMQEFHFFQSQESSITQQSELNMYLDEPRLEWNSNMDVLSFWKVNQFRYPELSRTARDVLSIPISTVASESAFSIGNHVLDQYRSSLKPENVEALICTRDWLFGERGSYTLLESIFKLYLYNQNY